MLKIKIAFDMDGTLADFYSCPDWEKYLKKGYTKPYRVAKTLVQGRALSRRINTLQKLGVKAEIISWSAKQDTPEYFNKIKQAKEKWLKRHYPSIKWDAINITKYGYKKERFASAPELNVLFDDNAEVRQAWETKENCKAYTEKEILARLDEMIADLASAI